MERRHQVFVSSTFSDLIEERRQVMLALLQLDCIPAGMELFPASTDDQWTIIQKVIDDSDYYVLVVGGRYGSTTKQGLSYTESEFDYALSAGKPILAFLHENPADIPAGRVEMDQEAQNKLEVFRNKVQTGRVCTYWRNAEDLGQKVTVSIVRAQKTYPAEGWVRGRFASSPEAIIELRATIDNLRAELSSMRNAPPVGTDKLAQGKDPFTVTVSYNVQYFESSTMMATLTWDRVFGLLGPLLLDETTEQKMARHLDANVFRIMKEDYAADAREGTSQVNADDFQSIKVQLFALGLMKKGERRRAATDTASYWKLTPYGESYMMRLRAVLRGEDLK